MHLSRKFLSFILLFGLAFTVVSFFPSTVLAAKRLNVLWIGNSLTQAPWCSYEGWFAPQVMTMADSNKTGVVVASYAVMLGATSISRHWSLQSGFDLMDNPVAHRIDDIWQIESVDHYDYVVLQTHTQSATVAAESTALCQYCDLALSKGIKPVIFACWDVPTRYESASQTFKAVYEIYKSRGALFAPLFQIHQSINAEKPITYLYNSGDDYGHASLNGAFLSMSVFYYLFTHFKPSEYDFSFLPKCAGSDNVAAEQAYLTGKAETVLSSYYSTATKHNPPAVTTPGSAVRSGPDRLFDISGRAVNLQKKTSMTEATSQLHGGVFIVKHADRNGELVIR